MDKLLNLLTSLKNELNKDRPDRTACMSLLDGSLRKVDEITKLLDKNTIHWAEKCEPKCPEEIDGKLTKYGVARMLGIAVNVVENRQRDARRGKNDRFPLPVAEADVGSGKPAHLWAKKSIEEYMDAPRQNVPASIYGQVTPTPRKRKKIRRKKIETTDDGLLTIHGVAKMLNMERSQVQCLLENIRKGIETRIGGNKGMFPLPVEQRHINGGLPTNLWRREDIEYFKECIFP